MLVVLGVVTLYVWSTLPFGEPESRERYTLIGIEWLAAGLIAVGATLEMVTWVGQFAISRIVLNNKEVVVHSFSPRTSRESSWVDRYAWSQMAQPIRITDCSRSDQPERASIPYMVRFGGFNRHQNGGLSATDVDAILTRARAVGMDLRESVQGTERTTTIVRPSGSHQ